MTFYNFICYFLLFTEQLSLFEDSGNLIVFFFIFSTCYIARLASLFPSQTLFGFIFFSPMAPRPNADHVLILEVSRSHTTTHHSRYDPSGRVISSSQRALPNNTQHLRQKNIQASGGIRTRNFSRREAADLRLRLHGHWDQHLVLYSASY